MRSCDDMKSMSSIVFLCVTWQYGFWLDFRTYTILKYFTQFCSAPYYVVPVIQCLLNF